MIMAIIILSIFNLIFIYLVWNLNRKNTVLQNIADQQSIWLEFIQGKSKDVYNKLKSVDSKNLFDKDDDVGFVFTEILKIIGAFDKQINYEQDENTEEQK